VDRKEIATRHALIMDFAKQHGTITSAQARAVSGFKQGYYHLRLLSQRGQLAHVGFNEWTPVYAQERQQKAAKWRKCPGCGITPKSHLDCDCLTSDWPISVADTIEMERQRANRVANNHE
jgi:hypothetical protein